MENTESAAKSLAVISACISQDEASLRILMRDKSYWKVLNILNIRGLAPLHVALNSRNMNILKVLIEHGAELTLLDANGDTPLHRACRIGFFEAVEFLCSFREVGVEMLNSRGQTPLEVALEPRSSDISYEDRYGTIVVDYDSSDGEQRKSEEDFGRRKCVAFLENKIREGKNARENDYLLETIRLNQLKARITEILRNTGAGRHKNYVSNYVSPASGDWTVRDYNTFYSNMTSFNRMAASVAASGVVVAAMNNAFHSIDTATTRRAPITRNKSLLEEIDYKSHVNITASPSLDDDAKQLEEDININDYDSSSRAPESLSVEELVEDELIFPVVWKGINIIINEGKLGNFDISNRKARRIRTPKTLRDRGEERPDDIYRRRDIRSDKTKPHDLPIGIVQSVIASGMDSVSIEAAIGSPQPFPVFCKNLVHNIMVSGIRSVAERGLPTLTGAIGESAACRILDAGLDSMRRDNYDGMKASCRSIAKSLMLSVFSDVYSKNAKLRAGLITVENQSLVIKHATLFVEDILERGLHSFSTNFNPSNRTFVGENSAYIDQYVAKSVKNNVSKEVDDNGTATAVGSIVEDFASVLVNLITSEGLHRAVGSKGASNTSETASSIATEAKQEYILNFSRTLVDEIITQGVLSLSCDALEASGSEVDIISHAIGLGLDAFNRGKNKAAYLSDIVSTIEGNASSQTAGETAATRSSSTRTIAADFIEDIIKCGLKSLVQLMPTKARRNLDASASNDIYHANVVAKSAISAIISDGLINASIAYSNKLKSSQVVNPSEIILQARSNDTSRRDFIAGLIGDVILQGIRRHAAGICVASPPADRIHSETGIPGFGSSNDSDELHRRSPRTSTAYKEAFVGSQTESAHTGKTASPRITNNDNSDHTARVPSNDGVSRPGSAGDAFVGSSAFLTA